MSERTDSERLETLETAMRDHAETALRDYKPPPVDPNSSLIWLPRLEATPLLQPYLPDTRTVSLDAEVLGPSIDGQPVVFDWEPLKEAAKSVGFPCFLRTDLASAKHDGPSAYRLDGLVGIESVALRTFEDNCLKDLYPYAFLVRQWLDLDARFSAFGFGGPGHPIAAEWRYFASATGVECRHFYWPREAIQLPDVESWSSKLAEMSAEEPPEVLATLSVEAATAVDGNCWSVDFARDKDGKWWLIDMALAERSWHPDHDESVDAEAKP